ncbi:MAG: hypothetical protein A3D35_03200 [Candidatus Staskawiczbacteria bacterium RIFCSPHIGHO2_02_FULL_34_9]|uniref:ZIP family metal transporter n=1 Tax=Candidatus Staskawiczbacteria bacterium RIFCSPHIGHO2_02_FULL_34_9 TaxID=1802206 RepID=A0A1G2I5K0_9BACT|nr:MAG: hypothetical protein A3D35_03200 [Candidatus Staskawiczbacteria bacterium RIFCSPHIGHO2_02_FULL_34_9]
MLEIYIYSFLSVLIVSAVSLVGLSLISIREKVLMKYMYLLISLAVGSLLGDAFIHIIPEAFRNSSNEIYTSILIIAGVLLFFIVEKFFHWHHHGEDENESHVAPVGNLVLFSDGVHNMIDGIIIGVSFIVSVPVGLATTIAVIFHEIPQEIGDFSVLIHSGYKRGKALFLNFLSALTAFLGLFIAFLLGQGGEVYISWALPIAAGGFIYIAVADLIPELHKTKEVKHSILQVVSVALGVLIMVAMVFIE